MISGPGGEAEVEGNTCGLEPTEVADAPGVGPLGDDDRARSLREVSGPFGLPSEVGMTGLIAAGVILLSPLLAVPAVTFPAILPKIALMIPLAMGGLVLLVDLARTGDLAARLGCAFLGWALLAAMLAPSTRFALMGGLGVDRGVLFLTAYLGCWALGRRVHPSATPLLAGAALVAIGANVLIGAVQVAVDLGDSWLASAELRAAGVTPSSVYLGGLCAGGMALSAVCVSRARSRGHLGAFALALVLMSLGANLTGSRIGLMAGVLAVAAVALVRRPGWHRILLMAGAVVLGVALSVIVPTNGQSSTGRIESSGSNFGYTRTHMWANGVEAWTDRPLVGWGPGRFAEATTPLISAEFARTEGPDKTFFDAHNVGVETLTTTGIVGLALLVAFVVVAARRARGPLLWLAVGIAATWLLEPVSMSTAPMALLALGAASPAHVPPMVRPAKAATLVAAGVGVGLGLAVLWGGAQVKQAEDNRDVAAVERAEKVFRGDPALADLRRQALYAHYEQSPSPRQLAQVVEAARETVRRDPSSARAWSNLAVAERLAGHPERAERAVARALDRNPWSQHAWAQKRELAEDSNDRAALRRANEKLCEIDSPLCEP